MKEKLILIENIKELLQDCTDLELLYFIQGVLVPPQPQPQPQPLS